MVLIKLYLSIYFYIVLLVSKEVGMSIIIKEKRLTLKLG